MYAGRNNTTAKEKYIQKKMGYLTYFTYIKGNILQLCSAWGGRRYYFWSKISQHDFFLMHTQLLRTTAKLSKKKVQPRSTLLTMLVVLKHYQLNTGCRVETLSNEHDAFSLWYLKFLSLQSTVHKTIKIISIFYWTYK